MVSTEQTGDGARGSVAECRTKCYYVISEASKKLEFIIASTALLS
jgi:hypothetical protein